MLNNVVYLLLRRLRIPLVVLILAYAVSILGMVLIPGQDDQGQPWRMGFFHAFYFVSFMGSTIGFGEIPYAFTDAQRLWVTVSLYVTVFAWLYGIGALLTQLQDPTLRMVFRRTAFMRAVRRLKCPYYVVCGYGDTGALVVRELTDHDIACVVIDPDQGRINDLDLDETGIAVPGLAADPTDPAVLRDAGVEHKDCRGVLAISGDDHLNLQIALAARLLKPDVEIIARADTWDTRINMASFGTQHIINPFEAFAHRFALMFHSPSTYLVDDWLTSISGSALPEFVAPPRGLWILCGYGRFGQAVARHLQMEGVQIQVIEANPAATAPPPGSVTGRGTEAETLRDAHIDRAVGIIAGTDNDANNLSIIVTAQHLRPELFTVARESLSKNQRIFEAARVDLLMQPSRIMARRIATLILSPLLSEFRRRAREQGEEWANILVSRVIGVVNEEPPETWTLKARLGAAPGLTTLIEEGSVITIGHLLHDSQQQDQALSSVPLLHRRGVEITLLPAPETALEIGDEILFCGTAAAERAMHELVCNMNLLSFVVHGRDRPAAAIWRWLAARGQGDRPA